MLKKFSTLALSALLMATMCATAFAAEPDVAATGIEVPIQTEEVHIAVPDDTGGGISARAARTTTFTENWSALSVAGKTTYKQSTTFTVKWDDSNLNKINGLTYTTATNGDVKITGVTYSIKSLGKLAITINYTNYGKSEIYTFYGNFF